MASPTRWLSTPWLPLALVRLRAKTTTNAKVGTKRFITVGFFIVFSQNPEHLRSSRIQCNPVLLQISWDYRAKGLMSVNDDANDYRVLSVGIKPWFFFPQKSGFCIRTKNSMHRPKKIGFFHTLDKCITWWGCPGPPLQFKTHTHYTEYEVFS